MRTGFAEESDPMAFQVLDDWERAADDPERAHDELTPTAVNLPSYNELVGR